MRGLALLVVAACGGGGGRVEHVWDWIPIAESRCMDGSSTGIGVNMGLEGGLVIFLEGGGACYDDASCATVAHQDGFGAAELEAFARADGVSGIFDRQASPLAEWTYVFVPYCSGDVHAGASVAGVDGRIHDMKRGGWPRIMRR